MALRIEHKKQIVSEINAQLNNTLSAALADYQGLTVAQITALRKTAKDQDVAVRVARNTLVRHAVGGTKFECMSKALVGPTLLVFSQDDLGAPARVLREFGKEHDQLKIKALVVDGKFYEANEADLIANLPTREEALARLMGVLQAPVQKMAQTLLAVPSKLVRTLAAVRDQAKKTES